MTVRELIKALMDCDLDANVTIEIESDRNSFYTVEHNFKVSNYGDFVVIEGDEE